MGRPAELKNFKLYKSRKLKVAEDWDTKLKRLTREARSGSEIARLELRLVYNVTALWDGSRLVSF